VNASQRIGNCEIDTIIGKRHKGALLTLVERKTEFTRIRKFEKKHADLVAEAAIDFLYPYQEKLFTITSDNGQEFAHHKYIKENTIVCFTYPIMHGSVATVKIRMVLFASTSLKK
jgi:IS30 family transposase